MFRKLSFFTLFITSLVYANNEFEININDKASEFSIGIYANDYYVLDSGSDYYVDLSYMTFEGTIYHTITKYGLRVASPFSSDTGVSMAFGIHGVKTEARGETFLAVPLGLYARKDIDDQIHVSAQLHYSPAVLNYFEAKEYREFRLNANYAIVDNNVYGFAGYRNMKTKYNAFSETPTSSLYFGVKVFY